MELYADRVASSQAKVMACELRSAKNLDDFSVYLVDLWDYCLRESLSEPFGMIHYLQNDKN